MIGVKPLPPVRMIRQNNTHRLIPSKYSRDASSVLAKLADNDQHLQDIFSLDFATNERLLIEEGILPGIDARDLVYDCPNHRVINAAFTHAHPLGSRFNSSERGAWYAAFQLETSQAEVAFHKATEYGEIGRFDDSITYDDYLADFSGSFHDIQNSSLYMGELSPDNYRDSQALAERLLNAGSLGIVYPSVRHPGGTCLASFRPSQVINVRKDKRYRFTWAGNPMPVITCVSNSHLA